MSDPRPAAPRPTRLRTSHWAIAGLLVALFAAGVSLRLHGFSLAAWDEILASVGGGPPQRVLLGEARRIRADDWAVHLPLALSQLRHDPPFPLVNRNIGLGQSALVPIELPVAHPFTLLRPQLLGFFLGPDVGIAWMWWTRTIGMFGVWLAVFAVLSGGRRALAALASALLLLSPFFQFWSLNPASATIGLGLAFLAAVAVLRARSPAAIAAASLALAGAGGAFLLALYPPYQITLAWLGAALVVGFALAEHRRLPRTHAGLRILAFAGAVAAVAALGAAYLHGAGDAVDRMRGSIYPGQRVSLGGERALFDLANALLGAPLWLEVEAWLPLRNVCEAASFLFVGPLVVAFDLARRLAGGRRIDPLSAAVALYAALLAVFVIAGLPESVASATLLGRVPGPRAVLGLGVADVILLVRFLGREPDSGGRWLAAALAAGWALLLAACAPALQRTLPGLPLAALLGAAALQGALGYALLAGPARRSALAALVAFGAATTLWFNPLAAGGGAALAEGPLARAVLEIDRAEDGGSSWVVIGRPSLAELLRVAGVRVLNGMLPVPQPALWRRLDPEGRQSEAYDRYGIAALRVAPGSAPRFQALRPTAFAVSFDPASPALRELGATHLLLDGQDPAPFGPASGFEEVGRVGAARLYRINAAPAPARAARGSANPRGTR